MTPIKRTLAAFMAALSLVASIAVGQTYPTNTPTYIPSAVLAATTLTTATVVSFQVNGQGTVMFRIAGTNSVMSGTVQITESRAASPTWTTVGVTDMTTGALRSTIVGNGLYRLNVSGAALVRFNLASFTGTNVIVSATGSPGVHEVTTFPRTRATFTAATTGQTVAASGTDFLTVTGSATGTIYISRASCQGTSDNVASAVIQAIKRSTANTVGSTYAATVVSLDSSNTTSLATVVAYTGNPTVGTALGNVASGRLLLGPSATVQATPLTFNFGSGVGEQQVVLRGATEVFALNANGATLATGHALQCQIVWTQQ